MNYFSLTLDDMSPHPKAGLNFESIGWCNRLIDEFPDIKITLFVPAAYARLGEKPYYLTKNLEWVKRVNDLPSKNYQIGLHGYFHRRVDGKHDPSNNDEVQFVSYAQMQHLIDLMEQEFKNAGLKHAMLFRSPGWKISIQATMALNMRGYLVSGLDDYYKIIKPKWPHIKWISANWNMYEQCDVSGNVIACGHTSNWTKNYFEEKRYNLVKDLLNKEKFAFKFVNEI